MVLPLLKAKLLEFTPAFAGNELTLPLAKGITTGAFDVRLIMLCVTDPVEDLVRNNLVSKRDDLVFRVRDDLGRQED